MHNVLYEIKVEVKWGNMVKYTLKRNFWKVECFLPHFSYNFEMHFHKNNHFREIFFTDENSLVPNLFLKTTSISLRQTLETLGKGQETWLSKYPKIPQLDVDVTDIRGKVASRKYPKRVGGRNDGNTRKCLRGDIISRTRRKYSKTPENRRSLGRDVITILEIFREGTCDGNTRKCPRWRNVLNLFE